MDVLRFEGYTLTPAMTLWEALEGAAWMGSIVDDDDREPQEYRG